jgi:uncharacterized coiled-coil protein SlyX
MPLPTVFETLDAVPEAIREHYTEREGKFYLEVDKPENVASGLAKKRDEVLREKKALAEKLAGYESRFRGKTIEEIEAILAATEQKETEAAAQTGNLDKVIERFKTNETQLRESHKAELDKLTLQLNKFRVDAKLHKAALDGGVIKEIADDVVDLIRSRVQLTDGDQLVILDKPNGDPMSVSVEKFFSDVFKNERPHYYEASGAGGSGASNGGKQQLTRRVDYSKLSPVERLKEARRQKA